GDAGGCEYSDWKGRQTRTGRITRPVNNSRGVILGSRTMLALDHPSHILHRTDDLPSQQQRDNESAERKRADGGDCLPVHAGKCRKTCTARAKDGRDPAPLISALADLGIAG